MEEMSKLALPLLLYLEFTMGSFRTFFLYMLCGIFGNIFACIFITDSTQGGEACVYGLQGAMTAFLLINAGGIKAEFFWVGSIFLGLRHMQNVASIFIDFYLDNDAIVF